MKRISALVLSLLFSLLFATSTLFAQNTATSGVIRGTVTDPSGAVIANAQITVTNLATTLLAIWRRTAPGHIPQ